MSDYQVGYRDGQLALAVDQRRERNLALTWHAIDFVVAAIGLGWSFYWWRKRRARS